MPSMHKKQIIAFVFELIYTVLTELTVNFAGNFLSNYSGQRHHQTHFDKLLRLMHSTGFPDLVENPILKKSKSRRPTMSCLAPNNRVKEQ
jgi:hypothetical protein